jgi:hypothetical protein
MPKSDILAFLNLESTVIRPPDEIIKKISNLSGLIDMNSISPSWRNDRKPEIKIPQRKFRNDSFQSLPSLNSSTPVKTPTENTVTRSVSQKYVSKFRNSEQQVEDKILNTIILSKLNKFSDATYNEIRDFLFQILGSEETVDIKEKQNIQDFVKEFMNLVFKKAASEEIFCPLYAKLLGEISGKYPIILDEMNKLHENYLEIFEESEENDSSLIQKNKEKKYRQGYSQFLAELTTIKILSVDKLVVIYDTIFKQIIIQGKLENKIVLIEQYIDCVLRISKVLRKKTEQFYIDIRTSLFDIVSKALKEINDNKILYISLSPKSRFLLMDIEDYLKGL